MEKSGILDDDIMAYRKGRSAEDIATCIVLMLEETNITGEPLAIMMEEEEKALTESPLNSKLEQWQ